MAYSWMDGKRSWVGWCCRIASNSSSSSVRDSLETSRSISLDSTFALVYVNDFDCPQSSVFVVFPSPPFFLTRDDTVRVSVFTNTLLLLHCIRLPNTPHAPPLVSESTGWQDCSTGFLRRVKDRLVGSAGKPSIPHGSIFS